jgi:osmotically inducible protein OsmC
MAEIRRRAKAAWVGSLREGEGHVGTASGALEKERYSFGTRFEEEPGTNPEELIAAAHAACYSMAFADILSGKGHHPERIETEAICILTRQENGGFRITGMHLRVRGRVPGIDEATFQRIAKEADQECPVSNLLRDGATIELDAALR